MDRRLTKSELQRYSRHIIMPELGLNGQLKIKEKSVLIIGVGGLGCPLSMYLAAAGIGKIGLVDFDTIDSSNLHRQVLYSENEVGLLKAEVAKKKLNAINPHVDIKVFAEPFTSDNAFEISKDYDILIDGTDNFPTRYLVNDVAVLTKKVNVFGSIFRFDGQITVFNSQKGPCYRCLYPEPPDPGMVPNCAEGGVLGILPGIVGIMQATETIKIATDIGSSLFGRLIIFDALQMSFNELKIKKNKQCPICGENPTIHELIDYQEFCGIQPDNVELKGINSTMNQITPKNLQQKLLNKENIFLLDVREPYEHDISLIKGSHKMPMETVIDNLQKIPKDKQVITICKSGMRSSKVREQLIENGYSNVLNLEGGINQWAEEVDNSLPIY